MTTRAEEKEYERALVLRNEITAIEHLAERQQVERRRTYDQDVIAWQVTEGKVYLLVFNVERGVSQTKRNSPSIPEKISSKSSLSSIILTANPQKN